MVGMNNINLITSFLVCYNLFLISLIIKFICDLFKNPEEISLKLYICKHCKNLCEKLKLAPIKISFSNDYYNCCFKNGRTREGKIIGKPSLTFGINYLLDMKQADNLHTKVPHEPFFNRIYNIIGHEIAHYLQYRKHSKWYWFYSINYTYNCSKEYYNKQKLESNANKIARILLKQYQNAIIK